MRKTRAKKRRDKKKKNKQHNHHDGSQTWEPESPASPDAETKTNLDDDWTTFEGKQYPSYVVDILKSGIDLIQSQKNRFVPNPSSDICDVRVKIGDLGNACWDVSLFD